MSPQLEAAGGLASCVVRWLKKGEPMPAWDLPSPEGTALEERNVRTEFARLLADMVRSVATTFRHTYSMLRLLAGAPITYISRQPGRLDASITLRIYAHWLPDVSRLVDRLDPHNPRATGGGSDDETTERKSLVLKW